MNELRALAVIPARMASSRFPGKPLAPILGLPMIEHVRRRALLSPLIADAIVATCDRDIMDAVAACGGRAALTSDSHERCTTRVEEAMRQLAGDIAVIVQGDEPLLHPDVLDAAVRPLFERPDLDCTNILSPLDDERDLSSPDVVKAAVDQRGFVMFFSRARIPYPQKPGPAPVFRQMGVMAFRTPFLRRYTALPETPFERVESIDMFRLLEHGLPVLGVVTSHPSVGVDHPGDVARVEQLLVGDPVQRALHERIARPASTAGGTR